MSGQSDPAPLNAVPAMWRDSLRSQLHPNEKVLAALETDLGADLRFSSGLLVLTDRRMMFAGGDPAACRNSLNWQVWQLNDGHELRTSEFGTSGKLELVDATGRVASWPFTVGRHTAAQHLKKRFERRLAPAAVAVNGE